MNSNYIFVYSNNTYEPNLMSLYTLNMTENELNVYFLNKGSVILLYKLNLEIDHEKLISYSYNTVNRDDFYDSLYCYATSSTDGVRVKCLEIISGTTVLINVRDGLF